MYINMNNTWNTFIGLILLTVGLVESQDLNESEKYFINIRDPLLTEIPTNIPPVVKSLGIEGNNLTVLTNQSFTHLPELRYLRLDGNRIYEIQVGAFTSLNELLTLDLRVNSLSYFEPRVFYPLSNLITLSLYNNEITHLVRGTFQFLVSLEFLRMTENKISTIEAGSFDGLKNLKELDLSYQRRPLELTVGAFNGLEHVVDLKLSDNKIRRVPASVFEPLKSLEFMDLSSNTFSQVTGESWLGLDSLSQLDLGFCNIAELATNSFSPLTNLTVLDLMYNNISVIQSGAFNGLHSLTNLSLQENQLEYLESYSFKGLPRLQLLQLHGNWLRTLETSVFYPRDFPSGHPENLTLSLRYQNMECDRSMCWLKVGEEQGWIKWYKDNKGRIYKPDCIGQSNRKIPNTNLGGFNTWDSDLGFDRDTGFDSDFGFDLPWDTPTAPDEDALTVFGWDYPSIDCSNTTTAAPGDIDSTTAAVAIGNNDSSNTTGNHGNVRGNHDNTNLVIYTLAGLLGLVLVVGVVVIASCHHKGYGCHRKKLPLADDYARNPAYRAPNPEPLYQEIQEYIMLPELQDKQEVPELQKVYGFHPIPGHEKEVNERKYNGQEIPDIRHPDVFPPEEGSTSCFSAVTCCGYGVTPTQEVTNQNPAYAFR